MAAAPSAQPVQEKKICRRIVPTGSVLAKRFCLSKSEWGQFNQLNGEDADRALRNRVNIAPPEGVGPGQGFGSGL